MNGLQSSVCRNSIPNGKSLHLSFLSRFEASTPLSLSLLSLHHVEALILQFWNDSITRAVFNMVLNSLLLCPSLELLMRPCLTWWYYDFRVHICCCCCIKCGTFYQTSKCHAFNSSRLPPTSHYKYQTSCFHAKYM
jgi:hypothetical protein